MSSFENGIMLADKEAGGCTESKMIAEEAILTAIGYIRQKLNINDGIDPELIVNEVLVKYGIE